MRLPLLQIQILLGVMMSSSRMVRALVWRGSRQHLSSTVSSRRAVTSSSFRMYDAAPKTPISFNSTDFVIEPFTSTLPLETINAHALDTNMRFDEPSHKYFWQGKQIGCSVTELCKRFFDVFDADLVIAKMKRGSNWPNPNYVHKDGKPWSDLQIKNSWTATSDNAKNRGTWMHHNIERFLNGLPTAPSDQLPELQMFHDFYSEVITKDAIKPYRTEWRIAAPDLNLAGSVDFVGKAADGYVLIDWKRSKKVPTSLDNTYGKVGKPPLGHIADCEVNQYYLQLNIYRHILQTYYGVPITRMVLASFHPAVGGYYMSEAPIWDKEVKAVLSSLRGAAGPDPSSGPATGASSGPGVKDAGLAPPASVKMTTRPAL